MNLFVTEKYSAARLRNATAITTSSSSGRGSEATAYNQWEDENELFLSFDWNNNNNDNKDTQLSTASGQESRLPVCHFARHGGYLWFGTILGIFIDQQ